MQTPPLAAATPLRAMAARSWVWRVAAILAGSWLIALSARINVPMWPVPMTMQTFAVLLVGALGGARLGAQTLAAYLAQGAASLPMFASGAGLAYMAGPTGGYLMGFLLAAILVGWLADRGWNGSVLRLAGSALLGHAIIFLLGVGWLATIVSGVEAAVAAGLTPFLPGMVAKSALLVSTVLAVGRMTRT